MLTLLSAEKVRKTYRMGSVEVHALKETTFTVSQGEIAVIIGKSCSGKSTLLNVLGGLIKPEEGSVYITGESIYDLKERERAKIRNQKCGFVFQSFNIINELTVLNNIRLPFDIAGKPYRKDRENELLELLNLEERKTFYPCQLSVFA
jgi:putative ABC transport system ATP-binding protein